MAQTSSTNIFSSAFWKSLLGRFGGRRSARDTPILEPGGLARFINTRAAHVAQTALYGYLRTRAGTRFPELFSNDAFVTSINIAKWHVWLACVSDLAVCAGGLVRRRAPTNARQVGDLMQAVVGLVLQEAGTPVEAGTEFDAHAQRVRARVALCDWDMGTEGEAAFSQSPSALVQWAPIVDELKALDEEIVRNSVRFRWLEVRKDLERLLHAEALIASSGQMPDDRSPRPVGRI